MNEGNTIKVHCHQQFPQMCFFGFKTVTTVDLRHSLDALFCIPVSSIHFGGVNTERSLKLFFVKMERIKEICTDLSPSMPFSGTIKSKANN